MEKKIISFKQFLRENEENTGPTGSTGASVDVVSSDSGFSRPETEREAKSRIAKNIVKSLFGDVSGLTGGVDSVIDQTKEVIESLPYKGCGISDPFKPEKTPLGPTALKIILQYLNDKGIADYSRTLKEMSEKRAVIVGVRNKIEIKKESSNQDRFCDALYFVPGNSNYQYSANKVEDPTKKDKPELAKIDKSVEKNKKEVKKPKNDDIFARLGKNKNESIEFIQDRIKELNHIAESSVWGFGQFEKIREEILFLNESIEFLLDNRIENSEFISRYEDLLDESIFPKKIVSPTGSNPTGSNPTGSNPTGSNATGDNLNENKITPYQITTVPSLAYYGKKPMNPQGVGIKLPGDTIYLLRESTLGKTTYKMMVEAEKIKVGRYPLGVTKFETYKPADVSQENCGMQIHRSSTKGVGVCIGPWSAGCQVFSDYTEWQEFIQKSESESMNNSKFLYALVQLDDIPDIVIEYANKGLLYTEELVNSENQKKSEDEAKKKTEQDKISAFKKSEEDKKEDQEERRTIIRGLANFIKKEKEKYNADEDATIKKYNSIIKSEKDWRLLLKLYGPNLWDDLDGFLSGSELEKLKYRDKKSTD